MQNLKDLEQKILSDEPNRKILADALRRCMFTENYISLTDAKSLVNFICAVYNMKQIQFYHIYMKDIIKLGHKILGHDFTENIREGA